MLRVQAFALFLALALAACQPVQDIPTATAIQPTATATATTAPTRTSVAPTVAPTHPATVPPAPTVVPPTPTATVPPRRSCHLLPRLPFRLPRRSRHLLPRLPFRLPRPSRHLLPRPPFRLPRRSCQPRQRRRPRASRADRHSTSRLPHPSISRISGGNGATLWRLSTSWRSPSPSTTMSRLHRATGATGST